MNEVFSALKPQQIARVAGAGNKMVYMIDQKADLYLNLVPGLKMWDMCAGEALIQSMMGIVCDSDHKPLIYDHTLQDFTIKNGIFVSKNKTVFDLTNQRLLSNTGNDLPYYQARTLLEVAEYRKNKAAAS
jgi:3'-phosphoadenosine 5'-phosphosulfate (PAPS) 3'-phosphatase